MNERLPVPAERLEHLIEKRRDTMPEPGPIDMGVLQTILLDEIAGRLDELGEIEIAIGRVLQKMESQMEKAPVGAMRPFTRTITGSTIDFWKLTDDVGRKCTNATVYNDGPDSVWVALNDQRNGFQEIKEGESLEFDFYGHALIERFFFYSTADGEANLRIPLEY